MDIKSGIIGIDLASASSKTVLFVTSGRKGISARSAAMVDALRQHGYEVKFQDVKDGAHGLNLTMVFLDELEQFKMPADVFDFEKMVRKEPPTEKNYLAFNDTPRSFSKPL